jgi:hypothetical protein
MKAVPPASAGCGIPNWGTGWASGICEGAAFATDPGGTGLLVKTMVAWPPIESASSSLSVFWWMRCWLK